MAYDPPSETFGIRQQNAPNFTSTLLAGEIEAPDPPDECEWPKETMAGRAHEDDEAAERQMMKGLFQEADGRYTANLPWRPPPPQGRQMADTFGLAMGRLRSLLRRHPPGTPQFEGYRKEMKLLELGGMVEDAPKTPVGNPYVIPHQIVTTSDGRRLKGGKIPPHGTKTKHRIVFDGSARLGLGTSLNDNLYRGPVNLVKIAFLLIRMRLHPIQVVADIERAYLQIGINPADRDSLRYLWLVDPDRGIEPGNIKIMRFTRLPFGAVCGGTVLALAIQAELDKYHPPHPLHDTASRIRHEIYVDNVSSGFSTPEEATRFRIEAQEIFTKCKMNLRGWNSNSTIVNNQIPDNVISSTRNEDTTSLGIVWSPTADNWRLRPPSLLDRPPIATKRSVLATISQVFDPLGMGLPIILRARMTYAEVCKQSKGWDDPVDDTLQEKWRIQLQHLCNIDSILIPRWVANETGKVQHIAVFSDASQDAYGACAYAIARRETGWTSNLIWAKGSTTTASLSIPLLELQALEVASRMRATLAAILDVPPEDTSLWCDSQAAVYHVDKIHNKAVAVDNRVRKIRARSQGVRVLHISGIDNPADLASRGCEPRHLLPPHPTAKFWYRGPAILLTPPNEWTSPVDYIIADTPVPPHIVASNIIATLIAKRHGLTNILNANDYSSWDKLLRITATILLVSPRYRKESLAVRRSTAEQQWIRIAQEGCGSKQRKSTPRLYKDANDIWRCETRIPPLLQNADLHHPIFLPKDHAITRKIMEALHHTNFHLGIKHLIAETRRRFYVASIRRLARKIISSCTQCRIVEGGPYRRRRRKTKDTKRSDEEDERQE
eukprot:GHVS01074529.1.p1 GENE.GHVS01074529.1~~GHVS01074529.1.p1  ORF type:complete len:901 (-),score=71.48 GHVS01074529.1:152-2653(-)